MQECYTELMENNEKFIRILECTMEIQNRIDIVLENV